VKARLAMQAADPIASSPEQFDALIKSEVTKWVQVVKENRLKVD
jgi:tripartite-type tricarboxylate transporter receptor subunit TctC